MQQEQEEFRVGRAAYWCVYIVLVVLFVGVGELEDARAASYVLYEFSTALWLCNVAILVAMLVVTYGRVKDIGWHGGWTLGAFVPFFNIIIGFPRTDYTHRN